MMRRRMEKEKSIAIAMEKDAASQIKRDFSYPAISPVTR